MNKKLPQKVLEVIVLFGPHEIVALAAFLATVMVWAVTLRCLFFD